MMSVFEIKETGTIGKGLFATTLIKKGEQILEFTGPVVSFDQVISKPLETHLNALQITEHEYLDLGEPGVLANHSCNPNAGVYNDKFLVALRDIAVGEQICYDYSTTMLDEEDITLSCRCQSPNCRQIIGDFPTLPAEVQKKYLKLNVVQSFIKNTFGREK